MHAQAFAIREGIIQKRRIARDCRVAQIVRVQADNRRPPFDPLAATASAGGKIRNLPAERALRMAEGSLG